MYEREMVLDKNYTNSRINCPVCNLQFAKNYLLTHLKRQHQNIYGTSGWEGSRYSKNFEQIKKDHKLKYSVDSKCQKQNHQYEEDQDDQEDKQHEHHNQKPRPRPTTTTTTETFKM